MRAAAFMSRRLTGCTMGPAPTLTKAILRSRAAWRRGTRLKSAIGMPRTALAEVVEDAGARHDHHVELAGRAEGVEPLQQLASRREPLQRAVRLARGLIAADADRPDAVLPLDLAGIGADAGKLCVRPGRAQEVRASPPASRRCRGCRQPKRPNRPMRLADVACPAPMSLRPRFRTAEASSRAPQAALALAFQKQHPVLEPGAVEAVRSKRRCVPDAASGAPAAISRSCRWMDRTSAPSPRGRAADARQRARLRMPGR